ncbi:MAG: hypothetical protein UH853_09720 [Muribaculaceae bacterium]|nr:hypothetical protein [Muribaculaceae bacterium]
MDRFFRYIFTVALVGLLWSCNDDMDGVMGNGTVTLSINATIEQVEAESRAVFTDADEINGVKKFSIYIYNGTTSDAKLIHCQEISDFPSTIVFNALSANKTYGAVLIGNSVVSELGSYATVGTSTLGDLNNATYTVSSHYNIPGTSPETNSSTDPNLYANAGAAENFTWSGYDEFNLAQPSLNFVLNPNMAKLKISVNNKTNSNTNPNDIIDIVSVHVKNVRDKVLHAQNALSDCGLYVEPSGLGLTSYIVENLELAPGQSKTRSYYIPHNEVATGGKVRPDAPANATYVEVRGRRKSDNMLIAYRIYPGTKVNNSQFDGNYHIVSDHKYNITVNINSDCITYDGSVNAPTSGKSAEAVKVSLPAGHNCYMIHPKISNTSKGTVYELPIDQINRFWGRKLWYTGEANEINDNTEWVAEVIWQDINARAIHFCDANGSNSRDSYSGTGKNPFYFKLNETTKKVALTSPNADIYGNILVGVRKKEETDRRYLWSWHLWVTDYNPNAVPSPKVCSGYGSSNTNGLYVQNGNFDVDKQGYVWLNGITQYYSNVQHYSHVHSHYWGTSASPSASAKVWDGNGMYADKWIMDRNLGAHSPNNLDVKYPTEAFGLYYQFGRKDPFPYKNVYDITGKNGVAKWDNNSEIKHGTISNGVLRPYRFYKGNESTPWAKDAKNQATSWQYWYSLDQIKKGEKSIFDPCPPGWCVPVADAFDYLLQSYNTLNIYKYGDSNTTLQGLRAAASIYFDTDINGDGPQRNMAIVSSVGTLSGSDLECLDATFPLQGNIAGESGSLVNIGYNFSDYGCIWTCESTDGVSGTLYQFKASSGAQQSSMNETRPSGRVVNLYTGPVVHKQNWIVSRGQPVRCIQEPYK